MANKTCGTDVCHPRATVTALLEFLYKWVPLHLVYAIAMLVCARNAKVALQSKQSSLNLPCGSEAKMMSSQSLYKDSLVGSRWCPYYGGTTVSACDQALHLHCVGKQNKFKEEGESLKIRLLTIINRCTNMTHINHLKLATRVPMDV